MPPTCDAQPKDQPTAAALAMAAAALLLAGCSHSSAPADTGTATLSWLAPQRNLDGSPVQELAGYTIYYGTEPQALLHAVRVPDPGLTGYVIRGLAPGTWYFSVAAFTTTGQQSGLAPQVSKVIADPAANQTAASLSH